MRPAARRLLTGGSRLFGTLMGRVPTTPSIYRRSGRDPRTTGSRACGLPSGAPLVLRAAEALDRLGHARGVVEDLGEAHDGDRVVARHLPTVELFEEVDEFLVAAELGVVVVDVARREVRQPH